MKSHRWNIVASSLRENERYCTCCEKPLGAAARMLELDQRTDTYHDFRNVPEDKSQGWFVFGLGCARKKVAEAQPQLCISKAFGGEWCVGRCRDPRDCSAKPIPTHPNAPQSSGLARGRQEQ